MFFFGITSHLILIKEHIIWIYRLYSCVLVWIQYSCMVSDCLKLIDNVCLVDVLHLQQCSIWFTVLLKNKVKINNHVPPGVRYYPKSLSILQYGYIPIYKHYMYSLGASCLCLFDSSFAIIRHHMPRCCTSQWRNWPRRRGTWEYT